MEHKRKAIGFAFILLFAISLTVSVEAEFELGEFWSRIDTTVVLTNETNTVNIGKNKTTPYKLNVNGSLYISNGTLNFDQLTGQIIFWSKFGATVFDIQVNTFGSALITFPRGAYTIVGTHLIQTIQGQKTFSNQRTFFAEYLTHLSNDGTEIRFQTDEISFNTEDQNRLDITSIITGNVDTYLNENLNVTKNITGNIHYAEMWYHNDISPNVTNIPIQDIWYNISAFEQLDNDQTLNGFTYQNNNLTCIIGGKYKSDYSITVSGTANNKYHFAIGTTFIPQLNTESHIRMQSVNDITVATGTGFIDLIENDKITLQVMNENGGNDITVYAVNINLIRIGD